METAEIKKISEENWYSITGKYEIEFEYVILGEGNLQTVIAACQHLLELLQNVQQ